MNYQKIYTVPQRELFPEEFEIQEQQAALLNCYLDEMWSNTILYQSKDKRILSFLKIQLVNVLAVPVLIS